MQDAELNQPHCRWKRPFLVSFISFPIQQKNGLLSRRTVSVLHREVVCARLLFELGQRPLLDGALTEQ
jgi:hypothetical protein